MDSISRFALLIALLTIVSVNGCSAPTHGGRTYSGDQTRVSHTVQYGEIQRIDVVTIKEDQSELGMLGGAVVGGVSANMIGTGKGNTLANLSGAIFGAVAGHYGEEALNSKPAQEITVALTDGTEVVVVQETDEALTTGDKVRVLHAQDGSARVRP